MIPTVQPPSLVQETATEHVAVASLADSIHKLYDILFQVALPKTKTARLALIMVDALCTAHGLVTAAFTSLQEGNEGLTLKDISNQLETITTHLVTPSTPLSTQNHSYATALTAGAQPPTLDVSPPLPIPPPCPHLHIHPVS